MPITRLCGLPVNSQKRYAHFARESPPASVSVPSLLTLSTFHKMAFAVSSCGLGYVAVNENPSLSFTDALMSLRDSAVPSGG